MVTVGNTWNSDVEKANNGDNEIRVLPDYMRNKFLR